MAIQKAPRSLFVIGIIIGGMGTFGLGALSAKALLNRNRVSAETANSARKSGPFMTEGFDFKQLRASNNEWRGPDLGVKIDLSRLQTEDGKTLASMVGNRPIMIVGVHPDCGMCKVATDEMSHLREKLGTMDVNYYLVSFTSQMPAPDFFNFIDSLKVGAPGFRWNAEGGPPPESLFIMTTPTHLLLNHDGTVIHVWPGSYQDLSVRQRMARQIIADTYVAIDALNAIAGPPAGNSKSQIDSPVKRK